MTIAAHCNWFLIARKTHQRPILSVAPSHPEEPKECASQQPSHISATSTALDTRTAPHLLGLVAICTSELHTVPDLEARSAVFWRESREGWNEGWHSSSSCSSYSSSSLLLQLPSSHSGLRPRVSVCSQTQQPRHFIFGAFPTSVGKYLYRLSVWLNLQESFELKKHELNMIMSSYIFGEQPLPILASAPIQCLGKIVSIWIYKQLLSCHNRPNFHPIGGDFPGSSSKETTPRKTISC